MACFQSDTKSHKQDTFQGYWVSKNFEYYDIDTALGGGLTMYGSGYLLKLDSNGQATSLGADYYWKSDSLFQGGEPGMTLKIGQWHTNGKFLFLKQKLASKTIMLTSDHIGQTEIDSFLVQGDSSMIHGRDTLIFVTKPSRDLEKFLENLVTFHRKKSGS